jgi:16S rRNA (guanine527-N7)-methyltransferase
VELSRISALLAPFLDRPLTSVQLEQISIYIDLLLRWNSRVNLTAVRDPAAIVTRHFGESFFLARHVFEINSTERGEKFGNSPAEMSPAIEAAERRKRAAHGLRRGSGIQEPAGTPSGAKDSRSAAGQIRVLDIGSGAGFPALPLKIWAPHITLSLIESNHKKAAFLREVSRALILTDVNVIAERAESLAGRLPPAGLVTLRAVERFQTIVPLALRFLAPAGRVALLIGAHQFSSLPSLAPNLRWLPAIPIPNSESRVLAISQRGT